MSGFQNGYSLIIKNLKIVPLKTGVFLTVLLSRIFAQNQTPQTMAPKFLEIHSTEYPATQPKAGTLDQFVAKVESGLVEGFYLKFVFEINDSYVDFESFVATVGGNTDFKQFRAYRDLPKDMRMGVSQQNLVWKSRGEMYFVNMLEFPPDRIWRMMTVFAPNHGLKFRRTQFERMGEQVDVRVHFYNGKELPF